MNRFYLLSFLLILFLSCGNSVSGHFTERAGIPPRSPLIYSILTAEEKKTGLELDSFFSKLHKNGLFNGSVLVARAGKVIYRESLGLLDRKNNLPLTDSSMFQLASVSKVITATAILLLHEREEIDIDKPFAFYFPDFPYQGVTIKELLSHRSGLANYIYCLNDEICKPNNRMNNTEMYDSFVLRKPDPYLRHGRRFNYCNTNYALLPLLVEKITGISFGEFLKKEIFEPIGMKNTATIYELDLESNNVTRPYDNRWRKVAFDASDYVLGDKSIYSTPYDLFLFSEALYQNKLVSPETQELAYTAFSKERKKTNYGYGWRLKNFNDPDKKEVYHNGWWHGYRSSFHRRLKDTLTVVILSNKLNSRTYQSHKVFQILDNAEESGPADEED